MGEKRRDKGEGGITKRSDGRYTVSYKKHNTTVKTEKQAKEKIKEWQAREARGEPLTVKRRTVKTYLLDYIVNYKQHSLKPKSYERIMQTFNNQVVPHIGDIQMGALSTENIQQMVNNIYSELSYSTAKKAYDLVNACMEHAVNVGQIVKNPCDMVILPRATAENINVNNSCYTAEQIKAITTEARATHNNGTPKYRYGYVILLLLATGMREGEALYLKWKDIDYDNNTIYVHGDIVDVKGGIIEQETPKTSKGIRYIGINDNAREALEKLKEIIQDNTRVIATENHNAVNPSSIRRTMKCILRKCNIQSNDINGCVHALRHTFATTLIRQGVDIKTVSEILGHSSVEVTMRIYYHVSQEQKQKAINVINNIF